jgi:hypothetical protein
VLRHGSPEIQFYAELPAPTCRHPAPETGFFLLDERLGLVRRSVDSLRPPIRRERLNLALAPGTYVYSLEMLDRACRAAARARYVLTVRSMDKPFLSDLALATVRGEEVPHRVAASQPIPAVYGLIVEAGAAAGFYWEVYGVDRGGEDPDRFTVRLAVVDSKRQRVSVRRLGEVARAAARAHPALDIEYKALAPAGSGPIGMGLSVGLPPEAAGVYLARVEVEDRRTKRRATAERWFYVRPARADGGAR